MNRRFGVKHRIISAIEKEDIILLNRLMNMMNHGIEDPVDKLGSNIMHIACYLGKMNLLNWISNSYDISYEKYNTGGTTPIHMAVKGCSLNSIKWLWEKGVDCHKPTFYYRKTPIQICGEMIARKENPNKLREITRIKKFLLEKYFEDKRGHEMRKFIWVHSKLKQSKKFIGQLPLGIAREVAEYI